MHQGAFGNEVLLLVHGQLVIEKDGKLIASIAPVAVVGERAVILNEPWDATVRAAFDSTILAMSRSELTLFFRMPEHRKKYSRGSAHKGLKPSCKDSLSSILALL